MQPVHACKNASSHAVPIGEPPFVIAGEHNFALPANGWMNCFHAVAAACGDRLDCVFKSGSLNLQTENKPSLEVAIWKAARTLVNEWHLLQ